MLGMAILFEATHITEVENTVCDYIRRTAVS